MIARPGRGRRRVTLAAVGLALLLAGGWEWEVSWAAPAIASAASRWSGWSVEIGRLWIAPWRGVRAQDVKLRPPAGGRVHLKRLVGRWRGVGRGGWRSHWAAGPVHLDPGSWKIHRPEAVSRLSAGPVLETVHGTIATRPGAFQVHSLRARGWALRGLGAGRWAGGQARWWARGQLASPLLAALGIRHARGAWEPCRVRAQGPARRPVITIRSRVASMTIGQTRGVPP